MNEYGRYLWVRSYQKDSANTWKGCRMVKFSMGTPKTIVTLCRGYTPDNIMVQKWSYDGNLLWASMNAFSSILIPTSSFGLDIDSDESIYYTAKYTDTSNIEHIAYFKLNSNGNSLAWVIQGGSSSFFGGLVAVSGGYVHFGGLN